jgi:hypothetical protein
VLCPRPSGARRIASRLRPSRPADIDSPFAGEAMSIASVREFAQLTFFAKWF